MTEEYLESCNIITGYNRYGYTWGHGHIIVLLEDQYDLNEVAAAIEDLQLGDMTAYSGMETLKEYQKKGLILECGETLKEAFAKLMKRIEND
jgi:hypothetical protein